MKNNFEKDMQSLEKIVESLNSGDNTLDQAIEKYKQGLDLTKKCYQQLQTTEKEVKQLISDNEEIVEKDFS